MKMKNRKKLIALILSAAVILGIAGCAKTEPELTREGFISAIEAYDLKQTDDIGSLTNVLMRRGGNNGYYVAADKEEAEKTGNRVLDGVDNIPDFKATDFVMAAVSEEGSDGENYPTMVCYIAFDNEKDATAAYNDLLHVFGNMEDGKAGTEGNLVYSIDSTPSATGRFKIGEGVYLQKTTVIYIRAMAAINDRYSFANNVCAKLGLHSPSRAGK
jgi:hypothetical protein